MIFFLAVLLTLVLFAELYSLLVGLRAIGFCYEFVSDCVEQGQEVPVRVCVINKSILPVTYLSADINFPADAILPDSAKTEKSDFRQSLKMNFFLWGKQAKTRLIPVSFHKRGLHYFRGAHIEKLDFAGLHNVAEDFVHMQHVLVYPKRLGADSLVSAMGEYCGDMIANRHLLRDPIITLGVREYTGREPMKTISWSQSARRGQLVVREFDYTRDLSCTVLMAVDGLLPNRMEQFDRCCSMARTVCQELTDRGIYVDFYTNSPIETMGKNKRFSWNCTVTADEQRDFLEGLALLYPGHVADTADVLASNAARAAGQHTAFVLIAPFDNQAVRDAVAILEEYSGMRVLLLCETDFAEE